MKHFGRSLLNPTLAAARRDFSAEAPLRGETAKPAQPGFKAGPRNEESAMGLAFRKAKTAIAGKRGREEFVKATPGPGRS